MGEKGGGPRGGQLSTGKPSVFHCFLTGYPQFFHRHIMHKLVVTRRFEEDSSRVRVISHHESMSDVISCPLCRRLLAAGFRIDLAQDEKPRGDSIRGEFSVSD